jgi:hypothetical protein
MRKTLSFFLEVERPKKDPLSDNAFEAARPEIVHRQPQSLQTARATQHDVESAGILILRQP